MINFKPTIVYQKSV